MKEIHATLFGLGKLLEKEMDTLKKHGDSAGLARTQGAYQKFLAALVSSKSGQTYESLQWAGENMLKLGHPKEAEDDVQADPRDLRERPEIPIRHRCG